MGRPLTSLRTRTLARDLALGITLTIAVVALIAGTLSHRYYLEEQEQALEAEADTLIHRLATGVSTPLWHVDHEAVVQLGRAFAARPDVARVRIVGDDAAVVFEAAPDEAAADLVGRTMPVMHDRYVIGQVEMGFSYARIRAESLRRLRTLAGVGFLITFAVVGGIYFLLRFYLTRPLTALTGSLHRLAEGDYTARVPRRGLTDLDAIADAVNTMAAAIDDRDRRLHHVNDELEHRVAQRTERLQITNTQLEEEMLVRRHAEASLAALTGELETKNATLKEKNAELERRNAEMERFTYTVSHDLKSPLVTIKNFLGFVERDAAAGDAHRLANDLGHIGQAADHMLRLLNDLLELSRAGRLMNPPAAVPLKPLVEDALAQTLGDRARADIAVHLPPAMPTVWGDRVRLLEVFQNLLANAIKFMGTQPDPQITIETRREQTYIVCTVRDNGMGIPAHFHDNIFGLFNRLHPEIEGTGVGLALVKRLVEVHGGTIRVASDGVGRGTAFHFTLPAAPQSPATASKSIAAVVSSE